jgi:Fuc2NAc and GlcNAc transferase
MASAAVILPWLGLLAAFTLSWALTGAIRSQAVKVGLMDAPNARSSHTTPTPRGGGLAIVFVFLLVVLLQGVQGRMDPGLCAALLGSGLLVATLGFIDDRGHVSARVRFLGHAAAASWALAWTDILPPVPMLGTPVNLGIAAVVLCGLYLVWSINLFNFMDGIDGIASLQAISVALGGALTWWLVQPSGDWHVAVLFAVCVAGFLVWNFPPARIFMGDAGSGFLGLVLGLLAIWSAQAQPHLFWCWLILGGCFMVDATTTLVRRVKRGESFHEAHRSHAYQYASRRCRSHKRVSLAVVAINTVWLLPMALAVALRHLDGVAGVTLAYAPLVWLAFHYKAGDRAGQEP